MLSAAVQRRLQAVVREELAFLSRRSSIFSCADFSASLMVHLASVCSSGFRDGGSNASMCGNSSPGGMSGTGSGSGGCGSGDESDDSFERERRLEHLRVVFGLCDDDAERVALLGDELRKAHRYVVTNTEGSGGGGGGGSASISTTGSTTAATGAAGGTPFVTRSELAELRMLAAVDRLCDKLRVLRPAATTATATTTTSPRVAGVTRPRSSSPGSAAAQQTHPKRARLTSGPAMVAARVTAAAAAADMEDGTTTAAGNVSKRARIDDGVVVLASTSRLPPPP